MTITQKQLDEWRALADAATAGPWDMEYGAWDGDGWFTVKPDVDATDADERFIAASRDAVPALLGEVERLRGEPDAFGLHHDRPGCDPQVGPSAARQYSQRERDELRSAVADLTKQRDEWRERALAAERERAYIDGFTAKIGTSVTEVNLGDLTALAVKMGRATGVLPPEPTE